MLIYYNTYKIKARINMFTSLLQKIRSNLSRILVLTTIFILFVIGGILRFHNLSYQSYWMDEGYTVNAVLSISEHGSTVLDSGQNYSCSFYCYPTAYIVKFFGESPSSYRLISAIIGILFIVAIYMITKKVFGTKVALLSSFFTTFSYWQIAWSRQARWYTLFELLFWLSIFFFYQSLYYEKRKKLNIVLTLIFTTLAIITHGLGYLLPIIFIGWIFIDQIFVKRKIDWKKSLIIVLTGLFLLWIFNLISNINVIGYIFNRLSLHYVLPYYLNFYMRSYWLFVPFVLIALFNRENQHKKETYFLLFILLAYFIPLSFFTDIVHYRYMFHLTPIFFIIGSIGLLNIHSDIKIIYGKVILWLIILSLFLTAAGGVLIPQTNYFLESDNPQTLDKRPYYAYTPQPNWSAAYNFIKDHKTSNDIVISSLPQFNKIFLDEAGYWIKYSYLGFDNTTEYSKDNKEYYVNAEIINNMSELKAITTSKHGYIVFDYMVTNGRISDNILNYIINSLSLVFHEKTNPYSEVWVYKF